MTYRGEPGTPYRIGNGTEGDWFLGRFCFQCVHDAMYRETGDGGDGCDILTRAVMHEVGEKKYPEEWTYNWAGRPCCTGFMHENEV